MIAARKFIYYSTILMLFCSALRIGNGNFYHLFYIFIAINTFLMMLMRRLWVPVGLLALMGYLLLSGCLGIWRDTDTVARVAKELTGISVEAFYFCCFFRTMDFRMEDIFRTYARTAYWISILGFLLFPIQSYIYGTHRLRSILPEPAAVAFTCLPALFYLADQWQRHRRFGRELVVVLIALVLTQSSTCYIGMLFGLSIFALRYRRIMIVIPAVVLGLGYLAYALSDDVAHRFDDAYNAVTSDARDVDLSVYVLYSNSFVMQQVLKEHPVMGNGLGSHGESFLRYIGSLPETIWTGNDAQNLNAEDGSSLGIRVLSDFGILGACLLVWFVWRFRPRGDTPLDMIGKSIWIYFLISILRGGVYFNNEMYFFICLYASREATLRWRSRTAAGVETPLLAVSAPLEGYPA